MIAVDLPGHGDAPATTLTPSGFASDVAALFDTLGLAAPAVVGHSVGGWTALELARIGRAGAVLALTPAGLWRRHSPRLTDLNLQLTWRLGPVFAPFAARALRRRLVRRVGLRSVSADRQRFRIRSPSRRPGQRPAPATSRSTSGRPGCHAFKVGMASRPRCRSASCGVGKDRIALTVKPRCEDELPEHALVETWPDGGHMVMWDQAAQTVDAALATKVAQAQSAPPTGAGDN